MAQVRLIFKMPPIIITSCCVAGPVKREVSTYFVYIEWFTHFRQRSPHHGLYNVKRKLDRNGDPVAAVVPLGNIQRSVHLFPAFGPRVPSDWNSANVLDLCKDFFVNSFSDRHAYHVFG